MIKCIKYATSGTLSNTRRKGNFLVGESTVSYGPTSSTGLYNSITPPEGGYTLYLNKETGGPSIYVFTGGTELLNFCNNNLGAAQSDIFGTIDWINQQNDYFVDPNYFEFTVKTNNTGVSSTTQFKLPLVSNGSINFIVDWGDNTTSTITSFNQAETTHTYSTAGTYTVKIAGILRGFRFANGGDKLKFLTVTKWGCLNITDDQIFYGCTNLTCSATDSPLITSTSLSNCFRSCTNFNGAIGNWDVSNVTSMERTFQSCWFFNQDIGNWDVSNVTNMYLTFFDARAFNQNIGSWDVSKVTQMSFMLQGAESFNQPIGEWNVSNVTAMTGMFQKAVGRPYVFNQPIGDWDTSKVTAMNQMFTDNTSFNQPIGDWDTSNVTTFQNMFYNATSFNQDVGNWNVSKATTMLQMFRNATSFNNGGSSSINNWQLNTTNTINMQGMFQGATPFNQPIGNWNVSKVTNFTSFMAGKTNANYSAEYLDSIYNNWSQLTLTANININFGTIKYNSTSQSGRNILTSSPNNWTITDGGQV